MFETKLEQWTYLEPLTGHLLDKVASSTTFHRLNNILAFILHTLTRALFGFLSALEEPNEQTQNDLRNLETLFAELKRIRFINNNLELLFECAIIILNSRLSKFDSKTLTNQLIYLLENTKDNLFIILFSIINLLLSSLNRLNECLSVLFIGERACSQILIFFSSSPYNNHTRNSAPFYLFSAVIL